MVDDARGSPGAPTGAEAFILAALAELRADVAGIRAENRADNRALEDRMTTLVRDLDQRMRETLAEDRRDRADYVLAHGKDHDEQRAASESEHKTFNDFIRNFELVEARKNGAIGVFRFGLELLSRHAKPLTILLTPVLTFLLFVFGNVRFQVVIAP